MSAFGSIVSRLVVGAVICALVGNSCALDGALQTQSIVYGFSTLPNTESLLSGSPECFRDLSAFSEALDPKDRKDWAVKFLDTSGNMATQFTWGQVFWLGSQSMCDIMHRPMPITVSPKYHPPLPQFTPPPFPVHYIVAYLIHDSRLQMQGHLANDGIVHLGMCLPQTCTTEDVELLLQNYFDAGLLTMQGLYSTKFSVKSMKYVPGKGHVMFQTRYVGFMTLFGVILAIVFVATIYDVASGNRNKRRMIFI